MAVLLAVTLTLGSEKAELTVDRDGRLSVEAGGAEVFSLEPDQWAPFSPGTEDHEADPEALAVEDIDFDGRDDLKIRVAVGGYNQSFTYFRFVPLTATFEPIPFLEALDNPEFDPVARTLVSHRKVRAWADLWDETTFRWGAEGWVPDQHVRTDLAEPLNPDSPVIESRREFRDGAWFEVSREVVD